MPTKPRVKKAKARKRVRHLDFGDEDDDWVHVYDWMCATPDIKENKGN